MSGGATSPQNEVTYRDACREAIRDALKRDPRVFLMGAAARSGFAGDRVVGVQPADDGLKSSD